MTKIKVSGYNKDGKYVTEIVSTKEVLYPPLEMINFQFEEEWPKKGDQYWFITDSGNINSSCWADYISDYYRMDDNNLFKTKEEAKQVKNTNDLNIQIRQRLKELNQGWTADYTGNGNRNWFIIGYRHIDRFVQFDDFASYQPNIYPAKSKIIFKELIKQFSTINVCRAFGVIK